MAIVEKTDFAGGVRVYDILTIRDEPAKLRVEGLDDPSGRTTDTLRISAHVGRYGDEQREAVLIELVKQRLEELDDDRLGRKRHPRPGDEK